LIVFSKEILIVIGLHSRIGLELNFSRLQKLKLKLMKMKRSRLVLKKMFKNSH